MFRNSVPMRTLMALVFVLSSTACGGDATGPKPPASLQLVSGDAQSAIVGEELASPLVVKVLDGDGGALSGISVTWAVTGGDGSITPTTGQTDAQGEAQATWTLGTGAGSNTATARVDDLSPITFHATANAGPPAEVTKVSGDSQTGEVGEALPVSVTAKVTDEYDNPVAGVELTWEITAGAGSVNPASVSTGTDGTGSTTWTLGTTAGEAQNVTAAAEDLTPVSFAATAEPGPVETVTVSPASASFPAGETQQLSATLQDRYGNSVTDEEPAWSSSNTDVASVDQAGLVTGTAPGPLQVTAEAGGQSGQADLEVLAATNPSISGIVPDPLVVGETATLTGTGFSPVPEWNVVTIDGVDVTVTGATTTQLTVTVPPRAEFPCSPTRSVTVSVTVPDLMGEQDHPLRVAVQRSLEVGESVVVLADDEVRCNELDLTGGEYLLTVTNTSTAPSAVSSFRLRGDDGTTQTSAVAPLREPGPAAVSPDLTPGVDERRAAAAHNRLLEEFREFYSRYGPPASRGGEVSMEPEAAIVPSVGDTIDIRVPDINANICDDYTEIRAEVVYSGTRGIVLEDVAAPLANAMDGYFEALGTEFDDRMFGILEEYFGNPLAMDSELDDNGRIFMVFSEVVNNMGTAFGFVSPYDFYPRSTCAASDVGELFYAQVPVSGSGVDPWYELMQPTVIHEAKHVTSFAERFSRDATAFEESWLEESTARISEELWARQIYGYGQNDNVSYAESVKCELQCANAPDVMLKHFFSLYDYYDDINNLTPLGRVTEDDATFYASGWLLTRWAADHYGSNEPAFFQALTQESDLSGVENLEARTAVSFPEMLGLWSLQIFTDDYGINTRVELTEPSWNVRDIFAGLNADYPTSFPYAAPLVGWIVSYGGFTLDVPSVRGGTAAYVRLQGTQSATQILELQSSSGGAPPEALRISIVRIQ